MGKADPRLEEPGRIQQERNVEGDVKFAAEKTGAAIPIRGKSRLTPPAEAGQISAWSVGAMPRTRVLGWGHSGRSTGAWGRALLAPSGGFCHPAVERWMNGGALCGQWLAGQSPMSEVAVGVSASAASILV